MTKRYAWIGAWTAALAWLTFAGCTPATPPGPSKTNASSSTTGATQSTPQASTDSTPSTETPATVTPATETPADPAPAEPKQETPAPSDPQPEPTKPTEPTKEAPTKEAPAAEPAKPEADKQAEAPVPLGTPELTAGIPGDGPLAAADIEKWLANPANHQPLQVTLPAGLSAAQASIYIPENNPLTRAKIELGRQLYFDARLSADGTVSCASCHHPDEGYGRHTQFGVGINGQMGGRNSPVSYNRIVSTAQFWDGRAASLEAQAVGPIANPIEMGNTHEKCVESLKKNDGYRVQFEKIFTDGVTIDNVGRAIASFERVIVSGPAPYDYYEPLRAFEAANKDELADLEALKKDDPELFEQYMKLKKASDDHPISDAAKKGRDLFFSDKSNCTACHAGANFSDEKYHNLGVGMAAEKPDLGRFEVSKDEKDRGAFKTPTLRNVELSAPYMHDGSQKTLEEVVKWYVKGGHPNPQLSDKVKKLDLNEQQEAELVAFMKALTGSFPKVRQDRLPQ